MADQVSAITQKRRERRMSLRHLASRAGCSHTTIAEIEAGHTPKPRLRDRINKILNHDFWPHLRNTIV